MVAKLEYEDLDVEAQLKAFYDTARPMIQSNLMTLSHRDQVVELVKVYSQNLNFSGDKTNYYNIKNSFMNDVFLRRKGIPLTLSLVFMGLCRLAGLRAVGISFPGHFMVRVIPSLGHFDLASAQEGAEDWKQQWFVDAFDSGKQLNVADCERRLFEWTRGAVPFGPDALKIAHPREIASRMLRNLKAIFMEKEDLARLYWVLTALMELCPSERLESTKERGVLMGRMGRFNSARSDLRAYLSETSDPEKRANVERILGFFENQTEFQN